MGGCCCNPCITYQTAEDLGKSGILYALLGCFMPCIPALLLRQEARERYNIEGDMRRCWSCNLLHCLCYLPDSFGDQAERGQLKIDSEKMTLQKYISLESKLIFLLFIPILWISL